MSQSPLEQMEREEIEMLLPWYVTGRLDPGEAAKVDAYLAAHPDVAGQLQLVRSEREETAAANEAVGTPPMPMTAQVMAAMAAGSPVKTAWHALRRSMQPLGDLFVV